MDILVMSDMLVSSFIDGKIEILKLKLLAEGHMDM